METWRKPGRGGALARSGALLLGPAGLEQDVDAQDVGPQEGLRIEDRAVDVRLGGEVDDGVGLGDERRHDGRVGDVAGDEPEARRLLRDRPRPGARLARLPA